MSIQLLAHAGHAHTETMHEMSDFDHCKPLLIGAGIITVLLLGIIVYLLSAWQPKKSAAAKKPPEKK